MQKLQFWIQVAGVLGIIVGTVLVVLQLQQNEELLRLQLATELRVSRDNARNVTRGENYAATLGKIASGSLSLTNTELEAFRAHADSLYDELHLRRGLLKANVFKSDWKEWRTPESCMLFNNPTGQVWLAWTRQYGEEDEILDEFLRRTKEVCGTGFVQYVRENEKEKAESKKIIEKN